MPLDKILVFVMAAAFFGFLFYVAFKSRREGREKGQLQSHQIYNKEKDVSPSGEKERRKPKS